MHTELSSCPSRMIDSSIHRLSFHCVNVASNADPQKHLFILLILSFFVVVAHSSKAKRPGGDECWLK